MARAPFIGAVLARETRPCPVAELVGVDRRVFRKVLRQLQTGAAADAGNMAAVRDDRSREISARIFVRVLGPGILRKDLVGLLSERLVDPFGIVGLLPPDAALLEGPAFIAVGADHDRHACERSVCDRLAGRNRQGTGSVGGKRGDAGIGHVDELAHRKGAQAVGRVRPFAPDRVGDLAGVLLRGSQRNADARTALHHRLSKEASRTGRGQMRANRIAAGGLAADRDPCRIASERGDVLVNPTQRRLLIHQAEVAGILGDVRMGEEPQRAEPVVEADPDDARFLDDLGLPAWFELPLMNPPPWMNT